MFHAPHVPHQAAVGGTVPGYAGHRPAAMNTHGESAWGGVPQRIDAAIPGQGVALPRTTAFEEVGQAYKPHDLNRTESFRAAVGGIKVGYGGHVPGERNHFGSNHQGKLPRVEYEQPPDRFSPHGSPGTRPLSEGEVRKLEFEPAWHLAQASGTAKQHFEVGHHSGKSAPFGLDPTNAPYVTEQARPNGTGGPRGQQMSGGGSALGRAPALVGREGPSGGVREGFGHRLPGAAAQSLYDRDVNKCCNGSPSGAAPPQVSAFVYSPPGSAAAASPSHPHPLAVGNASGNADLTRHGGRERIGLHHSAAPDNRGGSRLDQFTNGAGQMDDWIDERHRGFPAPPSEAARVAQQARRPSHAYETEMLNPRGTGASYKLSHMGIERAADQRPADDAANLRPHTPPPTAAGAKHRSRIGGGGPDGGGGARNGPQAVSPVPFDDSGSFSPPQPTGGGGHSNPFSSRLLSPLSSHRSNRSTPRSAARAASGVDQVRRYGQPANRGAGGSRAATPPATPPMTPTGGGGARAHGRPTGTSYHAADAGRGSPPQPQPQMVASPPPQVRADWRGVPAIREGHWGGHGRAPSPRAWRREQAGGSSWMYEA